MNASFSPISASTIGNSYTFTGREFDAETGLYHFRNRDYHAQLGRFMSRDPIGYGGSQWNLYEYVSGNPITRLDAYGLWWWDHDWIQLGLGGLLGFHGEDVQAEAGQEILDSAALDALDKLTYVDPTPLSDGVQTVIQGMAEGDSVTEIAGGVLLGALPGPNPQKGSKVCKAIGALDDAPGLPNKGMDAGQIALKELVDEA
jgi:RHS repeat-associated protein